jgi:transcriptional regulator with XRE-family HTH domain
MRRARERLPACEVWELTRPALPPRSRLYHLAPIGVGTPEVEGLTGYVARLAEAHGVTTRTLVVAELLPLLGRPHLLGPVNRGLSAFWQHETGALNGTRTLAHDLVAALEAVTLRRDLRWLTLLPWADVLPPRDLTRRCRAWCPTCYAEWRESGQVVYEPLRWCLVAITACPRHQQRLRQVCPYPDCRRPSPALAQRTRPGHCAWCERWLGVPLAQGAVDEFALTADEWQAQRWAARAVGELLAAAPSLPVAPLRERVARRLSAYVEHVAAGNVSALARALGIPMVTVAHWRHGRGIPTLGLLLQLCSRLGTMPLRFLTEERVAVDRSERQMVSLNEAARRPAPRRTFDAAAVQATLEAVLASDEHPPPAMRQVAQRLGRAHSELLRRFPALCRAISARYLAYQRAKGAQRRQQRCAEIRRAVVQVHDQGCYPSASRIAPLLSQPGFIRDTVARAAWQEALRELGWRT